MTSKTLSAVEGEGLRLDKFLSNQLPELSRTKIQKMINDGLVFVNNTEVKASLILVGSEFITYTVPDLNINIKDITKPKNRLPLSPKNNFGSLKREKLKHKKINNGTIIIVKNKFNSSTSGYDGG